MKKIFLTIGLLSTLAFIFPVYSQSNYTTLGYANECIDITYNLRLGSRDNNTEYQVSLLQDFLSPTYLYLPVGPTGYFGQATLRAVKSFQRDHGISQTGYVGPMTRAKIRELTCGAGGGGVCTKDLKMCPNGTVVERTGRNCQFVCPTTGTTPIGGVQTPMIYSIYPSQATVGSQVTISGAGFVSYGNEIMFNNTSLGYGISSGAGTITFIVPRTTGTPCPPNVYCIQGEREVTPGTYTIRVKNQNGTSNSINLIVTTSIIIPPTPTTPTIPSSFSASPTSGTAPLNVQFYADRNVGTCDSNVPYTVEFGDGTRSRMEVNSISYPTTNWSTGGGTPCGGYFITHTYNQVGAYTARLYKTVYNTCVAQPGTVCPLWVNREDLVGTLTITVSQTLSQLPVITDVQSVRTGSSTVIYVGEEARVVGSNLALIFPPSGLGARLEVRVGNMQASPYNVLGNSLSFMTPLLTPGSYTVTVTNSFGVSNAFPVTVLNQNVSAPTIMSFTANPPSREINQESVLSWVTQNATSCSINGSAVAVSGSTSTRAFTSDTYTLSCVGLGGTVSQTLYVPVYVIDCQEGYYPVNGICTPTTNMCTKDAMVCPGGTTVGRIPPLCNFAACPPYMVP